MNFENMDKPLSTNIRHLQSVINDIPPAILQLYTTHAAFYMKIKYGNKRKWFSISMQSQIYFYFFDNKFIYDRHVLLLYLYFFSVYISLCIIFQVNNHEIVVNFSHIITWHDIQQLCINLPEITRFVQLMNWQTNPCKFV